MKYNLDNGRNAMMRTVDYLHAFKNGNGLLAAQDSRCSRKGERITEVRTTQTSHQHHRYCNIDNHGRDGRRRPSELARANSGAPSACGGRGLLRLRHITSLTVAQPLHGWGRQAALPQPQAPGRSPIGQGKATLALCGGEWTLKLGDSILHVLTNCII